MTKKPEEMVPLPVPRAYDPAKFNAAVAAAMMAVYTGTASPHQQKMALHWIVNKAAMASGVPCFRPGGLDGQRETDFALGRAFVGQQILGVLKLSANEIVVDKSTQQEKPK